MQASARDESHFDFDRIGPLFRLFRRKKATVLEPKNPILRRILVAATAAWLPLLLFSAAQGRAIGPTPQDSLLLDLATYARFLVAVPLLIAADRIISSGMRKSETYLLETELIRQEELPAYRDAVARARTRSESVVAEVVLLGLVFLTIWLIQSQSNSGKVGTWRYLTADGVTHLSLAGLWNYLVSVPILEFLFLRWLWRSIIWGRFLWSVSKLNLQVVATHPDHAGGLALLGLYQVPFVVLAVAFGSVLSANAAYKIIHEGVNIGTYEIPFIAYLVIFDLIVLAPLLPFFSVLTKTRREGLRKYARLASRHNLSFQHKWVEGGADANEQLLGTPDISATADLGGCFALVQEMRVVPFTILQIVQITIIAALPLLPLLLLVFPIASIIEFLLHAVL